jgi:3-methyladenine DNA glycosylase AlkD
MRSRLITVALPGRWWSKDTRLAGGDPAREPLFLLPMTGGATAYSIEARDRIVGALGTHRDPGRAGSMARYMRDQFPFLGIPTEERRALHRAAVAGLPHPAEGDLAGLARALYALPEREYQYVAVDHVIRHVDVCGPGFLAVARELITSKSWWDTVDGLAAQVVGPLVKKYPELVSEIDRWAEDSNLWVARTAILHQLKYKGRTDEARLFRFCERRAADREFFIRKAIGWALREYSKTNPTAVQAFIARNDGRLSGLSKREGTLWITGRKPAGRA